LIKTFLYSFLLLLLTANISKAHAQTLSDSAGRRIIAGTASDPKIDSVMRVHSPRVAAIRSAILPGWGQVYNKKYWKLPIIYGALGTTAGIFVYNLNYYKRFRYAYRVLATKDSGNFDKVHPDLKFFIERNDLSGLQYNRDEFRRNIDYTVLVFLLFWGLNVVDASVDAHLKSFDVSPDLSLQLKAGYSEMARTNGFSLVIAFK
jgi:hypothetical protein